jgi:hypothetical protein
LKLFDKGNGQVKAKDNKDIEGLDEQDLAEIEFKVRKEIEAKKAEKHIATLKAELYNLEHPDQAKPEPVKPAIPAVDPKPQAPANGHGKAKNKKIAVRQNDQGLFYFEDLPNVFYDGIDRVYEELQRRQGLGLPTPSPPPSPIDPLPKQPKKLAKFTINVPFMKKAQQQGPEAVFEHVSDETINLQAHNLMPNSDKILFIDPKVVGLPPKGIPQMKRVLELMSMPVQKKPIDPRLLIAVGIMFVMVVIGIIVLYTQFIKPQQEAEQAYNLQLLQNGGNTTGLHKPGGSGSGGLFQFQPPNPFGPPPAIH